MEAKARAEEALISQSSGKDAIAHVIAAVELYMKAVQEAATPAERTRIKKKCRELMAYGESLKTAAPPPPPPPAVEAAMSSLTLETKPASPAPTAQPTPQAALPPTSSGTSTPAKASGSPAPSHSQSLPGRSTPLSSRELPKREQIILLRASKLHGSVFPPWDAAPADDVFKLASSANVFYEYVLSQEETYIQQELTFSQGQH